MKTEQLVIFVMAVVIIILSVLLYSANTCNEDGYKKCKLSDDSSVCIPDSIYSVVESICS